MLSQPGKESLSWAGGRGRKAHRGGGSVLAVSATNTQFRDSMLQVQQTCACGQKYWPAQRWIHEKCGVVNHQETTPVATNAVVNRKADRHNKEARREYMREYMRKKRLRPTLPSA